MFWNSHKPEKITSEEYNILLEKINRVQFGLKALELDLELYTRKLKQSKGLSKGNEGVEDKSENYFNDVIVKS